MCTSSNNPNGYALEEDDMSEDAIFEIKKPIPLLIGSFMEKAGYTSVWSVF